MSNKQLRNAVRLIHLVIAGCMAVFIYSPLRLDSTFAAVVQLLVVPVVVISGIVMWQQPLVVKFFNRGRGQRPQKSV